MLLHFTAMAGMSEAHSATSPGSTSLVQYLPTVTPRWVIHFQQNPKPTSDTLFLRSATVRPTIASWASVA